MMKAIIFDIDSTILYSTNRAPFNWEDLSGDKPIPEVVELIRLLSKTYIIILSTGRPKSARERTIEWFHQQDIPYNELAMNDGNPYSSGSISKEKALIEIKKSYEVVMAFDDSLECAEMYMKNDVIVMIPLNYKYTKLIEQKVTQPLFPGE